MSNTAFKKGDKVRRRKEFQDCLWSSGSNTLTVSETRKGEIQVKEFNEYWWTADRFELVIAAPVALTFEEQLALAKTYVGKRVFYEGQDSFIVDKFTIPTKESRSISSICNEHIRKHGWCVMIEGKRDISGSPVFFPASKVQLAPEFTEVTLNYGAKAKIYDDKVMVHGIQFSHAEIKRLAANLP